MYILKICNGCLWHTFGSGMEYADYIDLNRLGAITTKGVATVAWAGTKNTKNCRDIWRHDKMQIGLQNPGIDTLLTRDIPF